MYDLPHHKERDEPAVRAFMAEHPFALVTGMGQGGRPVATQLPLFHEERDGRRTLVGHMMRGTDHHRGFEAHPQVLAVFSSPNVYVSGSWYSNPNLPSTWNYISVHVHGTMRFLGGDALEEALRKTSLHFEGDDTSSPTTFDNLPRALVDRLVKMIVAFEIEIESIDNVYKLSQDRDEASYDNIIERLQERGDAGRYIAGQMARRRAAVFGPPGER